MRLSSFVIIFSFLLCVGCTTDIGATAQKHGLRVVRVEPGVEVVRPLRFGFDAGTGNLTVALAGLIVNEMHGQRIEALGAEMATHEIQIPILVHDQAVELLRGPKGFEIATNTGGGTFVIAITQYGFDGAGFKNSRYIPFIVVKAQLLDVSGKRVWSGEGQANPIRDDDVGARFDEYAANPQLLRDHWQHQIGVALKRLLTVK